MKNKGISLIEVIVYIFIFFCLNFFIFNSYFKYLEKVKLDKQVLLITSTFRKYQKYSEKYYKNVNIYVNLEEKFIMFNDKKINLDNSFVYYSKNINDNLKFKRKINTNGNLNKGFSIIFFDKRLNKLLEISFNSINSMSYPIISVRYEK